MNIIGRNEDSNLKLYFFPDGKVRHVPRSIASLDNETLQEEHGVEGVVVVDNFVFEATLIPTKWIAKRQSGNVYFEDKDGGNTALRMTQRNLMDLLQYIIEGKIVPKDGGLYGLYTFDVKGNTLTIGPYEYE